MKNTFGGLIFKTKERILELGMSVEFSETEKQREKKKQDRISWTVGSL